MPKPAGFMQEEELQKFRREAAVRERKALEGRRYAEEIRKKKHEKSKKNK